MTERAEISEILPVASGTDSAAQYILLVTQDPAVAAQDPIAMLAFYQVSSAFALSLSAAPRCLACLRVALWVVHLNTVGWSRNE